MANETRLSPTSVASMLSTMPDARKLVEETIRERIQEHRTATKQSDVVSVCITLGGEGTVFFAD